MSPSPGPSCFLYALQSGFLLGFKKSLLLDFCWIFSFPAACNRKQKNVQVWYQQRRKLNFLSYVLGESSNYLRYWIREWKGIFLFLYLEGRLTLPTSTHRLLKQKLKSERVWGCGSCLETIPFNLPLWKDCVEDLHRSPVFPVGHFEWLLIKAADWKITFLHA